jgi:hypothetical protein
MEAARMRLLLKLTLLTTLLTGPTMLRANFLTFSHAGGNFDYLFTLVNPGSSGVPVFDVYLIMPDVEPGLILTLADPTVRVNPVGWGDDIGGVFFVGVAAPGGPGVFLDWAADASTDVYNIQPGDSADFGFTATEQLTGDLFYALNGDTNLQGPVSLDTALPLPEPSGPALIGAGLLVIGALWRAKTRRRDSSTWRSDCM